MSENLQETGVSESKGRATPGRRQKKKSNEIVQTGSRLTRPFSAVIEYIKDVRSELEKVTWPTREDVRRLTYIVLVVTIASSIALGAVSIALTELFRIGLDLPVILLGIVVIATAVAIWAILRSNRTPGAY